MISDAESSISDGVSTTKVSQKETLTYLRVLTEGSVESFFRRFMQLSGQQVLLIVSPFIGDLNNYYFKIPEILKKTVSENTRVYVLTREPKEEYHRQGILALSAGKNVEIRYNSEIHAKLYVSWGRDEKESFALFGSGNLTSAGVSHNLELGMMILSRGYGRKIVRELYTWGSNLRTQSMCIKPISIHSK